MDFSCDTLYFITYKSHTHILFYGIVIQKDTFGAHADYLNNEDVIAFIASRSGVRNDSVDLCG